MSKLEIAHLQNLEKCSPNGRDCIENDFTQTFNCTVTCEGIYADVEWVKGEDPMEMTNGKRNRRWQKEKMDLLKLISEYKEFKRAHFQHFRFNSEASTTMFGNFCFLIFQKISNIKHQGKSLSQRFSWCKSTLTRRPLTTSSETKRSSLRRN